MPLPQQVAEKYKTKVFVETGTHKGVSAQTALDAGFPEVRTVDLDIPLHPYILELFKDKPVKKFFGPSTDHLWDMIKDIDTKITFWLDAHNCGADDHWCPIMDEIAIIAKHQIKNHTIMIDDVRWFPHWQLKDHQIKEAIRNINPMYDFVYESHDMAANDILVGYVHEDV